MDEFRESFEKIVLNSFSYYDVTGNNGENFYHAFVMGLLYSNLRYEEKEFDVELKGYHVTKIAIVFKGKNVKIQVK